MGAERGRRGGALDAAGAPVTASDAVAEAVAVRRVVTEGGTTGAGADTIGGVGEGSVGRSVHAPTRATIAITMYMAARPLIRGEEGGASDEAIASPDSVDSGTLTR